jgi:hypothetical protein
MPELSVLSELRGYEDRGGTIMRYAVRENQTPLQHGGRVRFEVVDTRTGRIVSTHTSYRGATRAADRREAKSNKTR